MAETLVTRVSDTELTVRRNFNATARDVFDAWTDADVLMTWWVPKSFGITVLSATMDARVGGGYRFMFGHPASDEPMAFFGRYLEVVPDQRLVWSNDESIDGPVTTVTLSEQDGSTEVVLHDAYPSKTALDAAITSGSTSAYDEQFDGLAGLLAQGAGLPA